LKDSSGRVRASLGFTKDGAAALQFVDEEGRDHAVKGIADWERRRQHILANLQEAMGPLPGIERRVPADIQVLETRTEQGYTRSRIRFKSEPGDDVPAWLLIPDASAGSKARRPAILGLHQTVSIGKDEPAGLGTNRDLEYGRELALRGYVVIAPDYPGFGEYKLDPYKLGYASASMKAIWNNVRAVDVLCNRPDVDPERIGAIGHSLGGHNAIFTAIFEPRIKAIVSSCGFNAFPYYYKGSIRGWSHKGYMPRLADRYHLDLREVPFDFPELIGALAPRAFFTNSPLHDANFEVEGVRVCLQSALPIYGLFGASGRIEAVYPNAQHSFPRESRLAAYSFLDRWLKPR